MVVMMMMEGFDDTSDEASKCSHDDCRLIIRRTVLIIISMKEGARNVGVCGMFRFRSMKCGPKGAAATRNHAESHVIFTLCYPVTFSEP